MNCSDLTLRPGDKVALAACSDGLSPDGWEKVKALTAVLAGMGLDPIVSNCLCAEHGPFNGTGAQRAEALMAFYADPSVKAIFDISGGDAANGVIEYLDFEFIRSHPKPFFGYSDLTCVLNALYSQAGAVSYLFQAQTLVWENGPLQQEHFYRTFFRKERDLFDVSWRFLQGEHMEGILLGGNVRCLLKLAGTPYWPDLSNKLLFLESLGGGPARIDAYFRQLEQMGAFTQAAGVLLGTFTELAKTPGAPKAEELLLHVLHGRTLPVAVTDEVGHANTSKCLPIGRAYTL